MKVLNFIKNIILSIFLYISSILIVLVLMFLPQKLVFPTLRFWAKVEFGIIGIRLKVNGTENIDPNKFYIFMGNHSSWSDIPCMCLASMRDLHFIAKAELGKNLIVGPTLRKAQMILIDRSNPRKSVASMKKATEQIQSGKDVMLFPEGTRTRNGQLSKFKRGGFKLAAGANVAIMPVGIIGSQKVWGLNNFDFHRGTITVNFGKAIETNQYNTDDEIAQLSDIVKVEIEKLLKPEA